ncbi:MAG: divalent-cation tolerance protein CutA [Rickettsiales bacterium]|nr:divalent-cation tolerance protein CutA [Rickettsiales bacterium]
MTPPDKPPIVIIYVTTPSPEIARTLAQQAVQMGLAACVNVIGGAESYYVWDGAPHHATEHVMLFKTAPQHVEKLTQMIIDTHPHECPCLLTLPIEDGHAPFMQWIHRQTAVILPPA